MRCLARARIFIYINKNTGYGLRCTAPLDAISCWLCTEDPDLFPVGGCECVEQHAEGLIVGFEFGDAFVFLFEQGLHGHGDIGGSDIDGAACNGAVHLVMVEDFRVVGGSFHRTFTEHEPVGIYIVEGI